MKIVLKFVCFCIFIYIFVWSIYFGYKIKLP